MNKNNKLKIKLKGEDNPYVQVKVKDRFGKTKLMDIHGYLVGMELAFYLKKKHEFHNLVIITGDVGSGKSTLIEGMAGVNAKFSGQKFDFDNVAWATEKFIAKTDDENNIEAPLMWDESIQGAGGRSMAISKLGNKLKIAFVTKRFKKHTYYLAVDEINEYAWKLIKMADAWIHVKKFGLSRGYFNAYTNKNKIKFIYNAFKLYNKDWNSKEVKSIHPDCKGKFNDYHGLFLNPEEYDKLKLEETKQLEDDTNVSWSGDKMKAFYIWASTNKTQSAIADIIGVHVNTVGFWVRDFKKYKANLVS